MEGACEGKLSSNFIVLFTIKSDVVGNGDIWLQEEPTMLKVDLSTSADIISGNILIHDDDFQDGSSP